MQWDSSPNAGFAPPGVTPWLPVHTSYTQVNVAAQRAAPDSLWHCYQRLLRLRKQSPALHGGALQMWDSSLIPHEVLAYRRVATPSHSTSALSAQSANETGQTLDVLLNFSSSSLTVELPRAPAEILFSTHREATVSRRLQLRPYEGLVIRPG
jgi:glycosidase